MEIAQGTTGAQPPEVLALLDQLACAESDGNKQLFLSLKTQLANQPSWSGSRPCSPAPRNAGGAKSTAVPTIPDSPTSLALFADAVLPSSVSALVKSPPHSRRKNSPG